jgi:hypothetical protein
MGRSVSKRMKISLTERKSRLVYTYVCVRVRVRVGEWLLGEVSEWVNLEVANYLNHFINKGKSEGA